MPIHWSDRWLPLGLLGATLLWVAAAASDLLSGAWLHVLDGDAGAVPRISTALVALVLALSLPWAARRWGDRAPHLWLGAAAAMLVGVLVDQALHNSVNPDEIFHLHIAWLVGQGAVPYRDFFHHQHLAWYLLAAPGLRWWADNLHILLWSRYLTILVTGISLTLIYRTLRRLEGHAWAGVILALAMTGYQSTAYEVRPDPLATMLLLASLWAAVEEHSLASGLAAGLAVLVSPKSLVAGALIGLVFLRRPAGAFGRFVAAAVAVSLLNLWVAAFGLMHDYLQDVFVFNRFYLQQEMGAGSIWRSHTTLAAVELAKDNPILVPLLLLGAVAVRKRLAGRVLVFMTAVLWGWALVTRMGDAQYIMFPLALLSVLGGAGLPPRLTAPEHWLHGVMPSMVILLVAFMALLLNAADPPAGYSMAGPAQTLPYVRPGGTYYGTITFNPIFRADATFYPQRYAPFVKNVLEGGWFVLPRPLDPDLRTHPPDVIVITDSKRRRRLLDQLQTAGVQYRNVGGDMWVR